MALLSELGSWVTGTSGPPRDSLFCCGARGDLAGAKVMGVDFGDGTLTPTVLGTITTSLSNTRVVTVTRKREVNAGTTTKQKVTDARSDRCTRTGRS